MQHLSVQPGQDQQGGEREPVRLQLPQPDEQNSRSEIGDRVQYPDGPPDLNLRHEHVLEVIRTDGSCRDADQAYQHHRKHEAAAPAGEHCRCRERGRRSHGDPAPIFHLPLCGKNEWAALFDNVEPFRVQGLPKACERSDLERGEPRNDRGPGQPEQEPAPILEREEAEADA